MVGQYRVAHCTFLFHGILPLHRENRRAGATLQEEEVKRLKTDTNWDVRNCLTVHVSPTTSTYHCVHVLFPILLWIGNMPHPFLYHSSTGDMKQLLIQSLRNAKHWLSRSKKVIHRWVNPLSPPPCGLASSGSLHSARGLMNHTKPCLCRPFYFHLPPVAFGFLWIQPLAWNPHLLQNNPAKPLLAKELP